MSLSHNRNALFSVKEQMIDRIAQFCLPRAMRARFPYLEIGRSQLRLLQMSTHIFPSIPLSKQKISVRMFLENTVKLFIFEGFEREAYVIQNEKEFFEKLCS